MTKSFFTAAGLLTTTALLFATSLHAQEPKTPKRSEQDSVKRKTTSKMISIDLDGAKLSCYFAQPISDKPVPGVLVIHEWWGLNDWVKRQADRYAENGYAALAVDLYRGEIAKDAEHAHELMRGLTDERAVADLKAAFNYLTENNATRGQPVGAIGWCMGGGFALRLAIAEPKLACSVVCYGKPVTDVEQLRHIKGPLLGVWGGTDRGIEVEPFQKALDEAKVKSTHHIYPRAGHAFLNETNERGYNKDQAPKAWLEIDKFLAANLKA